MQSFATASAIIAIGMDEWSNVGIFFGVVMSNELAEEGPWSNLNKSLFRWDG